MKYIIAIASRNDGDNHIYPVDSKSWFISAQQALILDAERFWGDKADLSFLSDINNVNDLENYIRDRELYISNPVPLSRFNQSPLPEG